MIIVAKVNIVIKPSVELGILLRNEGWWAQATSVESVPGMEINFVHSKKTAFFSQRKILFWGSVLASISHVNDVVMTVRSNSGNSKKKTCSLNYACFFLTISTHVQIS